jgi:hypothetical protein
MTPLADVCISRLSPPSKVDIPVIKSQALIGPKKTPAQGWHFSFQGLLQ